MSPSFAVVIPVYNGSEHLAETLESVLRQSIPPQEVIVVEDGSPIPSGDVVSRYPSVRYIEQENSGVSQSRNHGASLATAEWICFLDQDDLILPNHLAQTCHAVAENATIDVCYSGRVLLTGGPSGWTTEDFPSPPDACELPVQFLRRCPFPPSGVCIRRSVFTGRGGFLSRYDLAEDWELWLRLLTAGHVFHHCRLKTTCYRVHPNSVSHCRPLPIVAANLQVIRERILPLLSPWKRFWSGRAMMSIQETDAAILLRQTGQTGAFRLLLKSIARAPFRDPRRYKIAGHMLLTTTGLLSRLHPRVKAKTAS